MEKVGLIERFPSKAFFSVTIGQIPAIQHSIDYQFPCGLVKYKRLCSFNFSPIIFVTVNSCKILPFDQLWYRTLCSCCDNPVQFTPLLFRTSGFQSVQTQSRTSIILSNGISDAFVSSGVAQVFSVSSDRYCLFKSELGCFLGI